VAEGIFTRCGLSAGIEGALRKFPEQSIVDAGYQAIWHGQKLNGVAIFPGSANQKNKTCASG
jgi:hypothetical protein